MPKGHLPRVVYHQVYEEKAPGGIKSSFSIALMFTTSRRIPTSASTNQGPWDGDSILLCGLVDEHVVLNVVLVQGYLAQKKQRPPRTLQ
jgi:hypothetical protein